jgi:(p)ppGpp synthase/HD superfamily hydrolase
MLEKAIQIVTEAFKDKKDKAGKPYLGHLERVSLRLANESEEIRTIAILHDILEDCPEWDANRLLEFFPNRVVSAVVCLTHKSGQSYEDYISQIMTNELSIVVKIADLKDNMDFTRLNNIESSDIVRLQKYHSAYKRLVQ